MGQTAHLSARRTHRLPSRMGGLLLVNPQSGNGSPGVDELADAARDHGVDTRVLRDGEDPVEVARAAAADELGVAGGDGSLAPVAAVAI